MKTTLITGATDGIGKATAKKLLLEGWKVIIIGRNPTRCESTVAELKSENKKNVIYAIVADLTILNDVKKASELFLQDSLAVVYECLYP
jgi:retinol dehydrogenase 12